MAEGTRTSSEVRPQLPWFDRVGMTGSEINSTGILIRVIQALLVVANPVTTVLLWGELLTLSRTRVRGWWLSTTAGAALVLALFAGWIANYNAVWRALARAVQEAVKTRDSAPLAAVLDDWQHWLTLQLPVAAIAATLIAGLVLSYRARFYGAWREREKKPANERAVSKALAQLGDGLPNLSAERADDVVIRLGVDCTAAKPFDIVGAAMRMHAVVGGPTGFGKSTTLRRFADQLLGQPGAQAARVGALFIDMKADPGMVEYLRGLARATRRRFHLVTVDARTSTKWNALARGDAAQVKSKLIEVEANSADGGFSEPHYRRLGERFLLVVATVLCELVESGVVDTFDGVRRPWRQDLPDLVRLMNVEKLQKQNDRLSPNTARLLAQYVDEVAANRGLEESVYGLYNRYALMADGPAGGIMAATDDGLDLLDAMRRGDVILFSLDAMEDASTARQLGNLALQDATYAFGQLAKERYADQGGMILTCVDEFSALGGSLLSNFYARGRAAGAATIIASQDLDADLEAVSPEFHGQVLHNANVIVLHQQRGETAPDAWAKTIGTKEVWKETLQVTADNGLLGVQEAASGVGSLREAHEFKIAPDTLRNLRQGEAIVIIGHPQRRIARVRIALAPTRAGADVVEHVVQSVAAVEAPAVSVGALAAAAAASSSTPRKVATTTSTWHGDPEHDHDDGHHAPVVEPED